MPKKIKKIKKKKKIDDDWEEEKIDYYKEPDCEHTWAIKRKRF